MKTFDFDSDSPVIPEVIADTVTQDRVMADYLCQRLRQHWRDNAGFRKSFKRKDHRYIVRMWFNHWIDSVKNKPIKLTPP